MADPGDILMGAGTVGAVAFALLKWSGSRNVSALDATLIRFEASQTQANKKLEEIVEELKDQGTRSTRLEKDVDQLKKDHEATGRNIEDLTKTFRGQIESIRVINHDRLGQAADRLNHSTTDLVSAIAALTKAEATIAQQAATIAKLQMGRRRT